MGGIKTLTLNYGYTLSESNGVKFYVIFYDQDPETTSQNPIKSFTISNPGAAQKTAYQETLDVNISGDCYIQIVPASPSNSTSNKDRFAIWNITWEKN